MSKKIVGKAGTSSIVQAGNMSLVSIDIEAWFGERLGGFKQGEMIILASRSSGKSMFWDNSVYTKNPCKEIMLPMKSVGSTKYKFSRAKWYTAQIPLGQFEKMQERIEWCEKHFGDEPQTPDAWSRWHVDYLTIKFRDSKDYEWYMLRWS